MKRSYSTPTLEIFTFVTTESITMNLDENNTSIGVEDGWIE